MSQRTILTAGAGEKTQYIVHEFNDNTIRFVLHYPGVLDAECLCAATRTVVDSVDILHASFFTDKLRAYWQVNPSCEESSYFQLFDTAGDPAPTAYALALLPILPGGQTQLRCCLVRSQTASSVVLSISHLCVDGGDGKYLLGKLVEAYGLLRAAGSAEGLAVKNGSRAAEQIYENVSRKELFSLLKNPISPVKSAFPYATEAPGHLHLVHAHIPAGVMAQARQRAKSQGATVNDLLLAAGYHAYAVLPTVDPAGPMSIMSMMDLRRHCRNGVSEGLCNMSGSLPTTLPDGVGAQLADTLAQVAAQTAAAKKDPLAGLEGMPLVHSASRTLPMGLLLQIAGKVYGSLSIGLTNLGNLSGSALALDGLAPTGCLFGGPLKKKPAMQISAISLDGACTLSVVGQYTADDAEALQSMLDRMADEVRRYAEGTEAAAQ